MAFESFYGGRQGASFVIVERFDAIDIEKTKAPYKSGYLAITPDVLIDDKHTYLYVNGNFIKRTADNYTDYTWDFVVFDGTEVPIKDSLDATTVSYQNLPEEAASGMVQLFAEGGDSTDRVNYGEYVIIDTPSKSDPDNGKVFRRGLDFNDDILHGAEYIGQIVGPQGDAPELGIDTEVNIQSHPGYHHGEYSTVNESIIPKEPMGYEGRTERFIGSYNPDVISANNFLNNKVGNKSRTVLYYITNLKTNEYEYYTHSGIVGDNWVKQDINYNDKITYSWVTIRDEYGNVEGALIGFTTPHLVEDFIAVSISPYDNDGNIVSPYNEDGTVKPEINLIERTDSHSHPFYQAWKLSVPKGIQGDTIENLEKIDTQAKKGAIYYFDEACTEEAGIISNFLPLNYNNIDFKRATAIPVVINNNTYYLKNDGKSTTTSILRYTKVNYDNKKQGEKTYKDVSPYNIIRSMRLNEYGDLFVDYTYDNEKEIGRIKLEKNALGIVCQVDNIDSLSDDNGVPIPPEYIKYAQQIRGTTKPYNPYIFDPNIGLDDRHIGWLASFEKEGTLVSLLYAYDYVLNEWYLLGSLDGSLLNPRTVIDASPADQEPDLLNIHGFWAVVEKRKSV